MAKVGSTLSATPASVTGEPTPVRSWQWLRDGSPVSGATAASYYVQAADEGARLSVRQIETNFMGVASATSAQTATVGAYDPGTLFESGEVGAWYDPSDLTTVFQDAAGTTPAGVGDPVGRIDDKSGNGNHATQTTSAARPVLQQSGDLYYLDFDGVDDWLLAPDHPFTYTGDVSFYAGFQPTSFQTYSTLFSAGTTGDGISNQIKTMAFSCSSTTQINVADRPAFATDIWAPSGVYASTDAPLSTGTDYVAGFVISNWSTHRSSGTTSTINGNSQAVTAYAIFDPTSLNSGPMRVGVYDNAALATSFFNFNMYGMVAINRTLTAAETDDLETYLAAKSGVTL